KNLLSSKNCLSDPNVHLTLRYRQHEDLKHPTKEKTKIRKSCDSDCSAFEASCTAPSTTDWSMGMRVAPCAVNSGSNRLWTDCRHLVMKRHTWPVTRIQNSRCACGDLKNDLEAQSVDYQTNFVRLFLKKGRAISPSIDIVENHNV
ncbi:hypothetical protein ALC56_05155, partial [Trachymyrmex septentrionalis]